jgi:hypothetical protein
MSAQNNSTAEIGGHRPPSQLMRAISFVYRFVVLLFIVAYREGNRDA